MLSRVCSLFNLADFDQSAEDPEPFASSKLTVKSSNPFAAKDNKAQDGILFKDVNMLIVWSLPGSTV